MKDINGNILSANQSLEVIKDCDYMNTLINSKHTLGEMVDLFTDDFPMSLDLNIFDATDNQLTNIVLGKNIFITVPEDFKNCKVMCHSAWDLNALEYYLPFGIGIDYYQDN